MVAMAIMANTTIIPREMLGRDAMAADALDKIDRFVGPTLMGAAGVVMPFSDTMLGGKYL